MGIDRNLLYDGFPVTEYYKDHIKDAVTIKRGGNWWSAVLLINEPKSEKNIIMFYKWQKIGDDWKLRSKYKISDKTVAGRSIDAIKQFSEKL